jgi:hypothetical protein
MVSTSSRISAIVDRGGFGGKSNSPASAVLFRLRGIFCN